jgi:ABC-2 type transport system permease protein
VGDGTLTAYARLFLAQARGQAQYRWSFGVELAASVAFGVIDIGAMLVLFRVTRTLGGFNAREAFLMAALAACGFAIADLAVGNIERIRFYVRSGLLDAILVRPLGAFAQLVAMDFAPRRAGRVAAGAIFVGSAAALNDVHWTLARRTLLVVAPLAGAVLFGAIFVAIATVAFWWIDSGELANGFTYGGRDFTAYPITIYSGLFRRLFAYGLGFAFVGYYPALTILGRPDPLGLPGWTGWASPLVAAAGAAAAVWVWRTGIRQYRSTGS